MWMIAGMAGGIQPWWHHVGAYHDDRRMYRTAEPVMKWHKANEAYLANRKPVASVGLVWSQRNTDFYGRESAGELVDAPYEGFAQALIRARIPYLPVHAADIDRESAGLIGAGAGQCRRALRCGVRGDSPVRGARRLAGRDRGEHAL